MTKQQIINELKKIGTEYMYQDIGYGGFYNDSNKFCCEGVEYDLSKAELKEMLDNYYEQQFGWMKHYTKEQLLEML